MTRSTQIGIILVVLLGILVGVAGGALAGGTAGYFIAQQEIARFVDANDGAVVQRVNAPEERELIPAPDDPPAEAPLFEGSVAEGMINAVQEVSPAVVTVINRNVGAEGSGSGVIVSEDGFIITNHHVVEDATDISVVFADSTSQEATLIGSDPLSDIAVIQVPDTAALPAVATVGNSDLLRPGEPVLAIGSPLGNFRNTVTSGVVSALNRSVAQLEGLIQTDASINRGNSGGPLINLNGEVVGINTLVVRGGAIFGGDQAEGLGFAVPSSIFRNVSNQLIQNGEMRYPFLGIEYRMIDGDDAAQLDLPVQSGALVAAVMPGTPADDAGLQEDDIITAVDGTSLAVDNSLRYVLTQYQPEDTVELTIQRGDQEVIIEMELGTRPDDLDAMPRPQLP